MERLMAFDGAGDRGELADGYDLERQLTIAERRYAQARGVMQTVREEWRSLGAHSAARPELVDAARTKFEAAAARCVRLRELIEDIEQRLEG